MLPDHVEKKQKKRKNKIKRNNGAKRQNEIFRQIKIVTYKYNVMVRLWHQLVVPRCFKALFGASRQLPKSKHPIPLPPKKTTSFAFTTIPIASMRLLEDFIFTYLIKAYNDITCMSLYFISERKIV